MGRVQPAMPPPPAAATPRPTEGRRGVYARAMRHAKATACLVLLSAVSLSRAAFAQDVPRAIPRPAAPSPDIVYLTGGGILQGTVTDVVPEVEVGVRLADEEVITVPQREILYWIRGRTPPAPAPAAPPARWADLEPDRPAATVHLEGRLASLQLDTTGRGQWTAVCTSPCDLVVPTGASYRVVGDALKPSDPFVLRAPAGERATLIVHGASRSEFTAGIVSLVVGTPASFLVALSVALSETLWGPSGTSETIVDAALVGSAAFAAVGLFLVLANWSTNVTPAPLTTSAAPPAASGWLRAPAWPSATERPMTPPRIDFPLLTARF
jgi:hypothetical protein